MKNTFYKMRPDQLVNLVGTIATATTSSPSTFGLTSGMITQLSDAAEVLTSSVTDVENLRASLAQAIEDRDAQRAVVVSQIAAIARLIYSKAGLSSAQIASTGLAVHDNSPTPQTPAEPTDLLATPFANGTVKLSWNRGTNGYPTNFLIEASADAENWNVVASATRANVTLSGFTPGQVRYFRVFASRNGINSLPSATTAIYLPSSSSLSVSEAA